MLYLIEILHQTTTKTDKAVLTWGCILSKFYIKPQQGLKACYSKLRCILSKFYIKPQRGLEPFCQTDCCILSKFYIKPQRKDPIFVLSEVVSYRNSTSNHNQELITDEMAAVVSYRNSTSNHNFISIHRALKPLYLIEILHQTTTSRRFSDLVGKLYLIEILHQTTTIESMYPDAVGCILSKFYIKPQLYPTRNKTTLCCILSKFYIKPQPCLQHVVRPGGCILSKFYIKPQLIRQFNNTSPCCILSKFYIKPQQGAGMAQLAAVVSYRNSTSNHNILENPFSSVVLYLIEILHQTTTGKEQNHRRPVLYLIEILHQTTTFLSPIRWPSCCILSKFYIKPQQLRKHPKARTVVSYRNSTSNHNYATERIPPRQVVSYRNSTSNHNVGPHID